MSFPSPNALTTWMFSLWNARRASWITSTCAARSVSVSDAMHANHVASLASHDASDSIPIADTGLSANMSAALVHSAPTNAAATALVAAYRGNKAIPLLLL